MMREPNRFTSQARSADRDESRLDPRCHEIPPQVLGNWTIRMKHTSPASYLVNQWEAPGSGWTIVYQQNQSITATGLVTFPLLDAVQL